eukprot:scaffold196669_cov28-Tisochrysis_lutea.AAC.10
MTCRTNAGPVGASSAANSSPDSTLPCRKGVGCSDRLATGASPKYLARASLTRAPCATLPPAPTGARARSCAGGSAVDSAAPLSAPSELRVCPGRIGVLAPPMAGPYTGSSTTLWSQSFMHLSARAGILPTFPSLSTAGSPLPTLVRAGCVQSTMARAWAEGSPSSCSACAKVSRGKAASSAASTGRFRPRSTEAQSPRPRRTSSAVRTETGGSRGAPSLEPA